MTSAIVTCCRTARVKREAPPTPRTLCMHRVASATGSAYHFPHGGKLRAMHCKDRPYSPSCASCPVEDSEVLPDDEAGNHSYKGVASHRPAGTPVATTPICMPQAVWPSARSSWHLGLVCRSRGGARLGCVPMCPMGTLVQIRDKRFTKIFPGPSLRDRNPQRSHEP